MMLQPSPKPADRLSIRRRSLEAVRARRGVGRPPERLDVLPSIPDCFGRHLQKPAVSVAPDIDTLLARSIHPCRLVAIGIPIDRRGMVRTPDDPAGFLVEETLESDVCLLKGRPQVDKGLARQLNIRFLSHHVRSPTGIAEIPPPSESFPIHRTRRRTAIIPSRRDLLPICGSTHYDDRTEYSAQPTATC